ncbi:hypothetical protein MNBD_ALPHA04-753 [hydrothermal vent metagenome]|uniref:Uncharacterized protein n=1 Tax=hydrothermal vent metagenome TaxID=652676 RepID=A0A3B0SM92_9ZZZZ
MKLRILAISSAIFIAAPAIAQDQAASAVETTASEKTVVAVVVPKKVKKKKITDRNHPDYRRCRSEPIIGSLARKRRVCMTNREWTAFIREGNKRSRELVEEMRAGATNGN